MGVCLVNLDSGKKFIIIKIKQPIFLVFNNLYQSETFCQILKPNIIGTQVLFFKTFQLAKCSSL